MAPLEIIIVGCSIAGPTLASFLLLSPTPTSEKPRITTVERSPTVRKEGQNVDVRGTGLTIIKKLGLEKVIRESTTGEEGVQLVDTYNRVWAALAADKSGKIQTPTSDVEILRGRLAEICTESSQRVSKKTQSEGGPAIEYIFDDYLDTIEQDQDKVHVRFAKSGSKRSFDLLVGADGLQSKTRRTVWGEAGDKDRVHKLGMYGAFFSMPVGETDSLWRRWYHAPGRRGIMLRPDIRSNTTTAFMALLSEDPKWERAAREGRNVEAQKALVEEAFTGAGWESERVLSEMRQSKDFYYDMVAQVRMDKWSKGRVVLLGDSA